MRLRDHRVPMSQTTSARKTFFPLLLLALASITWGDGDDPKVTYADMYQQARVAYTNERWFEAIEFMERALEDWRWYRDQLADCRVKCRKFASDLGLERNVSDPSLVLAGRWILNAACQRRCKRDAFGSRSDGRDVEVDGDFESFKPYNYLQLAYYKASSHVTQYQEMLSTKTHQAEYLEKAIQCAFTYLLKHPEDRSMRQNIDFYKSIPASRDTMYVSREEPRHQKYYKAASQAYDKVPPDFLAVKENMEVALEAYFRAYDVCEAHCETPMVQGLNGSDGYTEDLYVNAADHIAQFIDCAVKCPDKISLFFGKVLENYLPNHYHYLQFAAYKVDDLETAAMASTTYLLFNPDDEDMNNNVKFFKSSLGLEEEKFTPDVAAVAYLRRVAELKAMAKFVKDDYRPARDAEKNRTLPGAPSLKEAKPLMSPEDIVPLTVNDLKVINKEFNVVLHADAQKLNGTHRFAMDNLATQSECSRLVSLASSATAGDGYGRFKDTGNHPHTPHESFKGMTVNRAAELAEKGLVDWQDAWIFLDLAEKARAITEKYFKLPTKLFFSFTHLVCRTAEDHDQTKRKDLSHPIHSDNCNLQEDGTCIFTYPAFTWRDFSSVLYLNADFTGGSFLFANPDKSTQAEVRPDCGRMVAFHNGLGNLHGVKAVTEGRRCALALWYTLDPAEHEQGQANHEAARLILTRLRMDALKKDSSSSEPESLDEPAGLEKSLDDLIQDNDLEVEDLEHGGYAGVSLKGPVEHNEL